MKYTGKYKEMAEQFRKDGADEYMVEKFIREEMERDEFRKGEGTGDATETQETERAREIVETQGVGDPETYTFRAFLLRPGFGGPEHKTVRKELLKRLSGHSAFPTKAAAEKFYERQKGKKAERAAAE